MPHRSHAGIIARNCAQYLMRARTRSRIAALFTLRAITAFHAYTVEWLHRRCSVMFNTRSRVTYRAIHLLAHHVRVPATASRSYLLLHSSRIYYAIQRSGRRASGDWTDHRR